MGPLRAFTVLVVSLLVLACAGTRAPEVQSSGAGACRTAPGDDACDLCTAAKCCPEESACMADSDCKAADEVLDACEAKREKTDLPGCYDAFATTGSTAKRRADCIRSNCAKACL